MALNFSIFLCPPEPLLQYPCARAQFRSGGTLSAFFVESQGPALPVSLASRDVLKATGNTVNGEIVL